jgi:hypothetical protein
MLVRVGVIVGRVVAVIVAPARIGVEVDPGITQGAQLVPIAVPVAAPLTPGPHRSGYAFIRRF